MKKLIVALGMLTCMFLLTPLANAATITFDGLAGEIMSPYTEKGFILTAADPEPGIEGIFYAFDSASVDYTGSEALINDYSTSTTLASADGSLFNLFSISLSEAFSGDAADETIIAFTAVYADATTYSVELTTDGDFGYEIFTFGEEFQNLASVSFGYDSYFQFDNITANPVPEPSTLLLLGSGIAFLAAGRRGKK
jgi:hypothetical protein